MGIAGLFAAPFAGCAGEYWNRKLVMGIGAALSGFAFMGLGFAQDKNIEAGFASMLGIFLACIATPAIPALIWDIPHKADGTPVVSEMEMSRCTNWIGAIAAVLGPVWGAGIAEAATFERMTGFTACILFGFALMIICGVYVFQNIPYDNAGEENVEHYVPKEASLPPKTVNTRWEGVAEGSNEPLLSPTKGSNEPLLSPPVSSPDTAHSTFAQPTFAQPTFAAQPEPELEPELESEPEATSGGGWWGNSDPVVEERVVEASGGWWGGSGGVGYEETQTPEDRSTEHEAK